VSPHKCKTNPSPLPNATHLSPTLTPNCLLHSVSAPKNQPANPVFSPDHAMRYFPQAKTCALPLLPITPENRSRFSAFIPIKHCLPGSPRRRTSILTPSQPLAKSFFSTTSFESSPRRRVFAPLVRWSRHVAGIALGLSQKALDPRVVADSA